MALPRKLIATLWTPLDIVLTLQWGVHGVAVAILMGGHGAAEGYHGNAMSAHTIPIGRHGNATVTHDNATAIIPTAAVTLPCRCYRGRP